MHALNLNTKEIKRLITYYKTYGITTFKKHVDLNHVIIVKKKEAINGRIKGTLERQPANK
jgi:hypothetical protein